jgi:flagellar L-ring protein precursor FlgH
MKLNRIVGLLGLLCAVSALAHAQADHQQQQQQQQQQQHPQQQQQPRRNSDPPPPTAADAFRQNGSSLLRATMATQADQARAQLNQVSFFAVAEPEPRVLKKHDLVTIIVREESSFESDASSELRKEAALEARIDEFIQLDTLLREFQLKGGGVTDPVPSIAMSGSRDFKGEGNVDRFDRLTLRVTAEVVDVKPNGTLVLQARQRIATDEEVQELVLSGVCRAEDVTADNTVLSTQMFDKEVRKNHKGTVRNATRRGWLSKLLDAVSPF